MNLILLTEEDFINSSNLVLLNGHRLKHINEVLSAKTDETLSVGLINGKMGHGKVKKINKKELLMEVTIEKKPPSPLPVKLILAMPRPKMLKRVLISISSMGVKELFIINSFRVEKSYWQTPILSKQSINSLLILGLEQAKDTIMPKVTQRKLFKPFAEDELADIAKGTTALIAHPTSKNKLLDSIKKPVTLAIGPEGGFIPYEVEKLEEIGFKSFQFGARVLKVETIIPALLAKLFY